MDVVDIGAVRLAVDQHGPTTGPAVLLIAGACQSLDWWTPEFCELLSAGRRRVIRYDHRDTGQSTTMPPGRPNYTGDDLARDAHQLLDALDVAAAHLVGMSMGGGIAQWLAATYPDRVLSLTLVESSPAGGDHGELPPTAPQAMAAWDAATPEVDWTDPASVTDHRVAIERPFAGPAGLDEPRIRLLATREVARSHSMKTTLTNHLVVLGETTAVDPATISVPTLVIHSVDDPLFPIEHGEALAQLIPHARLLRLAGFGHEIPPPPTWSRLVPEMLRLWDAADEPVTS